jgi:hypothetical protein
VKLSTRQVEMLEEIRDNPSHLPPHRNRSRRSRSGPARTYYSLTRLGLAGYNHNYTRVELTETGLKALDEAKAAR